MQCKILALLIIVSGLFLAHCGGGAKKAPPAECDVGETDCNDECVDLDSDPEHCGDCDIACDMGSGEVCLDGVCVTDCGDLTNCDGACVDLATDPDNCGGCGSACDTDAGEACLGGTCVTDCGDLTDCYGTCVDTETDPDNCGSCGNGCDPDESCDSGTCVADCGELTDCDGSCVDLSSDPEHCGSCDNDCDVANGTSGCEEGSCVIDTCADPYEDCDESYETGCETNTDTSVEDCGSCGTVCTVTNGTPGCEGGSCTIDSCTEPYADCDESFETGCETNTNTSAENCGSCGNACTVANGTGGCADATCFIDSCSGTFANCDDTYGTGCETDLDTDSDNCGSCGTACTTDTGTCEDSTCLSGQICIHAGEMTTPGTYDDGPVYATVCSVCTLTDFSLCPRYFVCSYSAPQCGGCITGLAGTYTLAVFIDTNDNASPTSPLPDSGDAIASSCNTETVADGASTGTTFVVTAIVP